MGRSGSRRRNRWWCPNTKEERMDLEKEVVDVEIEFLTCMSRRRKEVAT
jgi:hypothetical protein